MAEAEKYQYFNGLKFTRDNKTGYYLNSTIRKRIHQYVWEFYHEPIPDGFEVHHVDFDKSNNSIENLQLLSCEEHRKLHGEALTDEERKWRRRNIIENAVPATKEWHRSEAGKEWHRGHYQQVKDVLHQSKTFTCENCGKEFSSTQTESRFCSNACRSAWRRKSGVDNVVRRCEYCGKEFTVNKYSRTKYCSRSCSCKAVPRLPAVRAHCRNQTVGV